ncbi:hypothetical protein EDC61_11337 [Sulfuritortus calidifontis]|uniref:Uncharacterized protein n=1 Tax=Sulfuritortus calidifontis TaxID=1914471 RepID=A0A4R3JWA1_9PROT|nr:DUF6781 family protein [Sulfuritortus calidifontis]TCS70884.1 hypothetical protein EDC61_11337 [Sulfuritortus calidifontis]
MGDENVQDVLEPVRQAASEAENLRARVRQLVTDAILKREADPKAIKAVMQAAVDGLGSGLAQRGNHAGEALKEAMAGLDEAVAKSVYAVKMAVEEAWGEGRQFADADLRAALEAVKNLEDDLVGTLKNTSEKTQGLLKTEFDKLREHLARTGTDTGSQVRDTVSVLSNKLNAVASGSASEARQTAQEAAGRLAAVTSGILRGLADAIDQKMR